jgi:hypothetical protein
MKNRRERKRNKPLVVQAFVPVQMGVAHREEMKIRSSWNEIKERTWKKDLESEGGVAASREKRDGRDRPH